MSRTKFYYEDVQQIKFDSLKSIMACECWRMFIHLSEFKKYAVLIMTFFCSLRVLKVVLKKLFISE